ncbi:hypothetical protein ACOME3_005409 [Neoechinorhynchus agilis]
MSPKSESKDFEKKGMPMKAKVILPNKNPKPQIPSPIDRDEIKTPENNKYEDIGSKINLPEIKKQIELLDVDKSGFGEAERLKFQLKSKLNVSDEILDAVLYNIGIDEDGHVDLFRFADELAKTLKLTI